MAVDTVLEKPLPSNLDAERSVLGAILLDNNALNPAVAPRRDISDPVTITEIPVEMPSLASMETVKAV